MTALILAFPGARQFRAGDVVTARGEPAMFVDYVRDDHGEPIRTANGDRMMRLRPFTGGGCRFVRARDLAHYEADDETTA
jgi:hypothetical protein